MNVDKNRMHTEPLRIPRTRRNHQLAVLTSLPAGKMVPIAAVPLLREDALKGRVSINVEMLETKELLMNPVNLRVTAYCVPLLALERFQGSRDIFDRSYMGQAPFEGEEPIPFIETHEMGDKGTYGVYRALGLHAQETDHVNTAYLEAYNQIWNFRARNRSKDITPRNRLAAGLAPAFWNSSRFEHIVPDFDQAVIDGEVALNIINSELKLQHKTGGDKAWVAGLIGDPANTYSNWPGGYKNANGVVPGTQNWSPVIGTAGANFKVSGNPGDGSPDIYVNLQNIFAELEADGITVSLSNIEMARRTQAFAKLRERYEGIEDEWLIDMLMDGLTIPDQHLKQPFLLADRTVRFRQAKRYATDAGNLAESAVSGVARADISLRVPRLSVGGVVMVLAEAMPEQLFERQRDPFFHSTTHETWPEFVRDTLDPEKVDVVKNGEIDTSHSEPDGTFGYAPMNWKWNAFGPRIGGKFYRPEVDATADEERMRLWAVENVDPSLSEDFYLVNDIHTKVFLDTESHPFEATAMGNCVIEGNTVFGGVLVEATANYDKIMEKAPTERIEKED